MWKFTENPQVWQNRLGELIIVTGVHLDGMFHQTVNGYGDDMWDFVCFL